MMTRTTRTTVTFARPFAFAGMDEALPAGVYDVETDEERLEGISFPAYRRTATLIHLPPEAGRPGQTRTLFVDPQELAAHLERDRNPAEELPVERAGAHYDDAIDHQAEDRAQNEGMTLHVR